ncbi:unnamed protein product, partial [Ilex paraguariensis]
GKAMDWYRFSDGWAVRTWLYALGEAVLSVGQLVGSCWLLSMKRKMMREGWFLVVSGGLLVVMSEQQLGGLVGWFVLR